MDLKELAKRAGELTGSFKRAFDAPDTQVTIQELVRRGTSTVRVGGVRYTVKVEEEPPR